MSVYVRPFKVSDLSAFVPLEPLPENEIYDTEFAEAIERSDLAVTGVRDGKVIGCGGVHPVGNSQGEMWLRLSPDCLKHKFDTLRWIKDGFKIIEETYPFKQLNASIRCCFKESVKLAEYLGFHRTQEVTQTGVKWFIYSKRVQ